LHDTYYVVAHFHYVLSMGAVFGMLAGINHWGSRMSGVKSWHALGVYTHFWALFIGVNLTFWPMHWTGLSGMPRRIPDYPDAWVEANMLSSFGSIISIVASLWFLSFLFYDLRDLTKSSIGPSQNTTRLFSMTATASLIPGEDNAELPQLASHCTLETFLYSPMPFHSTVESPSAYLGAILPVTGTITQCSIQHTFWFTDGQWALLCPHRRDRTQQRRTGIASVLLVLTDDLIALDRADHRR
jgi:heme/copper-type cytochrome/quinol oxidase subunit 1